LHVGLLRLAFAAFHSILRLPFRIEVGNGTRCLRAAHQIVSSRKSGAFPVELGEQRAARIGCDRRD
jgi:hypothetical protein